MKKIFIAMAVILAVVMFASCASSRRVGCPNDPANWRPR
jgi:outer membrane murein-binding lipoprotein Lpp